MSHGRCRSLGTQSNGTRPRESVKAGALARLAVALAVARALGVIVGEPFSAHEVTPGAAEEARALRAVQALVSRVALAQVVLTARSLS